MNRSKNRTKNLPNDQVGPFKDLYIYYFSDRLKFDKKILGDDFIGNWEED